MGPHNKASSLKCTSRWMLISKNDGGKYFSNTPTASDEVDFAALVCLVFIIFPQIRVKHKL